ncbi:MAG: hypothetical protein CVV54_04225 [Synergistetes bacterium HGW-Synergistetes-1]|nr:MAG: hypothetical protein CVV54_04225 [Synergistetes bacterium HGW-Synergistetes-1]
MKVYIEMRKKLNRTGVWAFKKSAWADEKDKGGHKPVFWSKIKEIRKGDIIFHLEHKNKDPKFIGYSIASEDGYITNCLPPGYEKEQPNVKEIFKVDLSQYTQLLEPIRLYDIFDSKKKELVDYYKQNASLRKREKLNLFYDIKKTGELECHRGAYISDTNDKLIQIIFGVDSEFYKYYLNSIKTHDTKDKKSGNIPDEIILSDSDEEKELHFPRENKGKPSEGKTRKGEYNSNDSKNKELGNKGEKAVLDYERRKLKESNRKDLIGMVELVSGKNDMAGYDIKSVSLIEGSDNYKIKYIEVKTTDTNKQDGFYMSDGELNFADKNKDDYCLYRIYFIKKQAKFHVYNYKELRNMDKIARKYEVKFMKKMASTLEASCLSKHTEDIL